MRLKCPLYPKNEFNILSLLQYICLTDTNPVTMQMARGNCAYKRYGSQRIRVTFDLDLPSLKKIQLLVYVKALRTWRWELLTCFKGHLV
jgi:hypothetical protein